MVDAAVEPGSAPSSPRLEGAVAQLGFPVVMGAAVAGAIRLIHAGYDPALAFVAAQLPAFAAVILLERRCPYYPDWNRSHGDLWVDVRHLITITAFVGLIDPLLRAAGLLVLAWLSPSLGLGLWPGGWPLLAQLALALVVAELGQYWVHRLQHEIAWLWRIHALHHSAPRLYWLNAARFHPLDIGLNAVAAIFVLVALGAGPSVLALWLLVNSIHGIFQHCNIPVRIGPLNWIFSMAELHRWHHSRLTRESNTNYGQTLAVWDVVFGTRFLPKDREPPRDIGLAGLPDFPMTYLAQLASPFRWSRITAGGSKKSY
jgi:sterol desaturase/sphingolipid hydroxylase (fatty acid hydroxylase superfamily)